MKDRIEDVRDWVKMSRIAELVRREENEEKEKKTIIIILCIIGAITLFAGIAYAVCRLRSRRDSEYDLYDDLDNYYDESDHFNIDDSDFDE